VGPAVPPRHELQRGHRTGRDDDDRQHGQQHGTQPPPAPPGTGPGAPGSAAGPVVRGGRVQVCVLFRGPAAGPSPASPGSVLLPEATWRRKASVLGPGGHLVPARVAAPPGGPAWAQATVGLVASRRRVLAKGATARRRVLARRHATARCSTRAGQHVAARGRTAVQHDIPARRCLTPRRGRLGPAAAAPAAAHTFVPRQRFRRAALIRARTGTVAAAAPRANGLAGRGRTRTRRRWAGVRSGTPAARPGDIRRTERSAAAIPVGGSLAQARFAAPPRSWRPCGPGLAGRRRAGTARGARLCQAAGTRPAARLRRPVRPGPRPEPGVGARPCETGFRASPGTRPAAR